MNKLLKTTLKDKQRIIVISDIHGGLEHLDHLLDKVGLCDEDMLILLGDFIEKGPQNLQMLYRAILLNERENTYILSGNCESFVHQMITQEERAEMIHDYIQKVSYPSLIADLYEKSCGVDLKKTKVSGETVQAHLQEAYSYELDFLKQLPWGLVAPPFIFVHAGIESEEVIERKTLLAYPAFYETGHELDKTVVVGHWPVLNYIDDRLQGNPILDFPAKILCLDGGYSVKWHGQVNCLVIEKEGEHFEYSTFYSDDLTEREVKQFDESMLELHLRTQPPFKVMWDDNRIEVIEKLPEFSLCKKTSCGEVGLVKNEFISESDAGYYCNDDYIFKIHRLKVGDKVRYIDAYGAYAFVKYKHEYGWIPMCCL